MRLRSIRRALVVLACVFVACARPTERAPKLPSATDRAPASAPAAAPSANSCAGPTECATCTAQPQGCRFCTESRTCVSMAASRFAPGECEGLSLGHPSSCGSDPVVAARVRAREIEARKQAVLDEERGMTLSGAAIGARLEHFSSIEIPVPAATCHLVVWRLAPDAKPSDVRVSLDFETKRSSQGGLTGFDLESRVGSTGVECSSLPGKVRFRLVDPWSLAHLSSGGTGALTFELYTRARTRGDPDDVGANATSGGDGPRGGSRGGSVGVDCLDCTFPCESSQTACKNECFRSGDERTERDRCDRTCDQIFHACLRGCPGCD